MVSKRKRVNSETLNKKKVKIICKDSDAESNIQLPLPATKKKNKNKREIIPHKSADFSVAQSEQSQNVLSNTKKKSGNQSPQKKNKSTDSVRPEDDIESDIVEHLAKESNVIPENNGTNSQTIGDLAAWSQNDLSELLKRIEDAIPHRDTLRHQSRADKLCWDTVAFGTYSPEQCKEAWETIRKKLRSYRILKEMVDDAKQWIIKPWTNFYRKSNRHPEMPRRPLTSYMLFYLKNKDKVLQENPGMEMTGLSRCIATMYKNMPPEKKEKYNTTAVQLRKEYDCKMEQFYQNHPELIPQKDKPESDTKNPHKPLTPFRYFCKSKLEKFSNDPNFDRTTLIEKCKEQWKSMNDKKKVFWIDLALEQEEKYMEQIKIQAVKYSDSTVQPTIKSILTKEEKLIKERIAGKPEKPPNSAYSLFSRMMLVSHELKSVSPKERMHVIAQQWKACTPEEKNEYKERVAHMIEQYKLEYATYLESLSQEKREEELLKSIPKRKKIIKPKSSEDISDTVKEATNEKEKNSPSKKQHDDLFVYPQNELLYAGEPEQPPPTAFLLFAKKLIKNKKAISRAELDKIWQMLPDTEKSNYQKKLTEMKQKYIKNYEQFLKGLDPDQFREYSNLKAIKKSVPNTLSSSSSSECDSDSDCDDASSSEDSDSSDSSLSSTVSKIE